MNAAVFAADGRSLVTASGDCTLRVWDAASGRELRRFSVDSTESWRIASIPGLRYGCATAAAVAGDADLVAAGTADGAVRIWSARTGEARQVLRGHVEAVTGIVFFPDGRRVVTASRDRTARIWDLPSGRELAVLRGHRGALAALALSPDGQIIATAADDGTVRLWDATSGRENRVFRGYRGGAVAVAFGDAGRLLLTASKAEIRLLDVASGAEGLRKAFHFPILEAALSPDGRLVVTSEFLSATVWDAQTGHAISSYSDITKSLNDVALAPNGRSVAVAGRGEVAVWSLETGQHEATLRHELGDARFAAVTRVRFSPEGRRVLTVTDRAVDVWDVPTGRHQYTLRGHSKAVTAAAFAPDGEIIVTGSEDHTLRVWDARSGSLHRLVRVHSDVVTDVAFTPDGTNVVSSSKDGTVRVWSPRDGEETLVVRANPQGICALAVAPAARDFVVGGCDGHLQRWDLKSGSELAYLGKHETAVDALEYSSDGMTLLAVAGESAYLWSANGGSDGRSRTVVTGVRAAVFLEGGRLVASAGKDNAVRIFRTLNGEEVLARLGVGERRDRGLISPDLHLAMSFLPAAADDDWIAISPDGRFDGTETGIKQLHYARGLDIIAVEAFFERFFTPGLTGRALAGARYDGPDVRKAVILPPTVRILSPKSGRVTDSTVVVAIEATDRGGGVEDIRLYHNGARVSSSVRGVKPGDASTCPSGATCFTVDLLPGSTNVLVATAFASDRTEAERVELLLDVPGRARTATLHVLAIGIDTYRNPRYNLNYGRADAAAFADSLQRGSADIYAQVRLELLADAQATRENILASFQRIAATARPEDVFVFYFAGHGTVASVDDVAEFFLVPSDVTQLSDVGQLKARGVSGTELRALFESVPARKRVMVLDACNSGAAVETFARRGAAEERAIAQLARSSGLFVVSATDSDQFATEVAALGHGVLTYALLSALGAEGPARPRTVREVLARVEQLVPNLSRQHRGRTQYPMVWSHGMDFPLVVR